MKIKKYNNFITENNRETISINDKWNHGNLEAYIFFDMISFKKWLNQYGEFDITDVISEDIQLPIGCIKNIKIENQFRNKGFGNKILENFIDKCIDNDVNDIILIADIDENQNTGFDLVRWYESKGFKIIEHINDNPVMILKI